MRGMFGGFIFGLVASLLAGCAGSPVVHPNRHEAGVHLSEAQKLLTENRPDQAMDSVKKALVLHRLANDLSGTIGDMNRLAHLNLILGHKERALRWIDRALLLETVSNHPVRKIETLLLGAEVFLEKGNSGPWLTEANTLIGKLPTDRNDDRERLNARLLQVTGLVQSRGTLYDKAIGSFGEALSIDRNRKDSLSVASDLANLGRNHFLLKHYGRALEAFSEAYAIDHDLHNSSGMAFDLEGISLSNANRGHYRTAARKMLEAADIHEALGHSAASRKDINYVRTILVHLPGENKEPEMQILDHWSDSE